MAHRFEFVVVSNPTEAPLPKSKKLAYSHAFRQAHARRRREQTEKYRKEIAIVPAGNVSPASEEVALGPLSQVLLKFTEDPFSSMARPLSRVEYFLLGHYVDVIVPFTLGHCDLFNRPGDDKTQLLREWVGLAITDNAVMVAAVLLSTCRYILKVHQPGNHVFVQLALQYKQMCLQTLRQEMSNLSAAASPVGVMTVAKALALALDEVTAGEHTIAWKHLNGVSAMVDSSGGVREVGMTGLLERMYEKMRILALNNNTGTELLCK